MPKTQRSNDYDTLVSERVRAYRISANKTLQELGKAIGVSYQQVQKYEDGRNRVSAGKLVLIAKFLGVTAADFFEGF